MGAPAFLELWLARLCESQEDALCAALFLDDPSTPVAIWQEGQEALDALCAAATAARAAMRPVSHPGPKGTDGATPTSELLSWPITLGARRRGALALAIPAGSERDSASRTDAFEAAARWLPILLLAASDATSEDSAFHLDMIATVLERHPAKAAYIALVSELATRLGCERVSLGFHLHNEIQLEAVSHSARFDRRSALARSLVAAMEEAVDAEKTVGSPTEDASAATRAHDALREEQGSSAVFTVLLADRGEAVGAITIEGRAGGGLTPQQVGRVEAAAAVLGPVLALRQSDARSTFRKIADAASEAARDLAGPKHPGAKLAVAALVATIFVLAILPATYRISAPARLEGTIQRAVVAPIEGYVAESRARAGDIVREGQALGAIDDVDLQLERRKWSGRLSQYEKEYRAALADGNRSEVRILRSRLDEAKAELALREEQIARTHLLAPFDGVVAQGDLSRSLGSPVERGEVLFEVAPLDSYRIVLEIDEADISELKRNQPGSLTLSALPGRAFALEVDRIVPVAKTDEGRNFFHVEARLEEPIAALRPGMEGVGKVEVGRRRMLWIWTHSLWDWVRLSVWRWLP